MSAWSTGLGYVEARFGLADLVTKGQRLRVAISFLVEASVQLCLANGAFTGWLSSIATAEVTARPVRSRSRMTLSRSGIPLILASRKALSKA